MSFAQKNYMQKLGNSNWSIADVGCLLTAICNGLEKLNGQAPDPPTLNQFFLDHGDFSYDAPDRAFDDLAWNSINKFDPSITVQEVGTGPAPTSANAIVKFHYTGIHTGQPVDHYCWVDHIENGQVFIIDSWDGLIKGPGGYQNVYHLPIAWATYIKHAPVPAPAAPTIPVPAAQAPPAAPVPYPSPSEQYTVIKTILGFPTATTAGNHTNATGTVAAGQYFVFNKYPNKSNLINVSKKQGQPGSWINTDDNVNDPEPAPAVPAPVEAVANPTQWKTGYSAFKDASGQLVPKKYVIMWPETPIYNGDSGQTRTIVKGSDGKPARYENILIAGTVKKDNVNYFRPYRNNAEHGLWWLIPEYDLLNRPYLMPYDTVYDNQTSAAERLALKTPTLLDRLANAWEDVSHKVTKIKIK